MLAYGEEWTGAAMLAYINGKLVPEEKAKVSIFDRGFLYGDGVFETIRLYGGDPFLWAEHWERLRAGAEFLGISLPVKEEELRKVLIELGEKNRRTEGICRVVLTRGMGLRGYSPRGAQTPTLVVSTHEAPEPAKEGWKTIVSQYVLQSNDRLASYKHCNKLRQVLARAEADLLGADEALLCNSEGEVVEGTSTNLFWVEGGKVYTPAVEAGILPGATRAHVMRVCGSVGLEVKEGCFSMRQLKECEGMFLTSSGVELVSVREINGMELPLWPQIERLRQSFREQGKR